MRIFSNLYDTVLRWAAHRHATRYLASLSFAESSFFPIPPDVMLAPMALAVPQRAWFYAGLTTVASVLGGVAGYGIGLLVFDSLTPFLQTTDYWQDYLQVKQWFADWGFWVILLAGFSPIPYKVFTITAGAVAVDANDDGELDGVVLEDQLWAIPIDRRPLVMLTQLMVPFNKTAMAAPDEDLASVLPRLNPLRPVVTVWSDGTLLGIVPPQRLRDRLQAGKLQVDRYRPGWLARRGGAAEFVGGMAEGMAMNLRRLDDTLGRRRVRPLETLHRPLDITNSDFVISQ